MTQRERIAAHFSPEQTARLLELPTLYPYNWIAADVQASIDSRRAAQEAV